MSDRKELLLALFDKLLTAALVEGSESKKKDNSSEFESEPETEHRRAPHPYVS